MDVLIEQQVIAPLNHGALGYAFKTDAAVASGGDSRVEAPALYRVSGGGAFWALVCSSGKGIWINVSIILFSGV